MKLIVQVDGGDSKGIIPSFLFNWIEQKTGRSMNKRVSMYSGASTGAVITGAKAIGLTGEQIYTSYTTDVINWFKKDRKHWYNPVSWFRPAFDRKDFYRGLERTIGSGLMKTVEVPCVSVTMGLCKGGSHFIKSWDSADGERKLIDTISWSALSAAWYFGGISVPDYKWSYRDVDTGETKEKVGEVFQDGGQGVNNCTAMFDLIELVAKGWEKEEVHIVSFGCGAPESKDAYKSLKEAERMSYLRETFQFIGQAREESIPLQVGACEYVSASRKDIKFHRIDCTLPKAAQKFGDIEHKDLFIEKAKALTSRIPLELFQ